MPRYKRKRKKTYNRRKRRSNYNGMVSNRAPIPRTFTTKMKYSTIIQLNPGVGAPAYHTFSANSIYDPDVTGTGHQPKGFDELTALFDHYCVLGSKLSATYIPTDGETVVGGVTMDDSLVFLAQFDGVQEAPECVWRVVTPGGGPRRITRKINPLKFLHKNEKDSEVNGIMGNLGTGASPTEQVYYQVWAKGRNGSADPQPIDVLIDMEFVCRLKEPRELGQS